MQIFINFSHLFVAWDIIAEVPCDLYNCMLSHLSTGDHVGQLGGKDGKPRSMNPIWYQEATPITSWELPSSLGDQMKNYERIFENAQAEQYIWQDETYSINNQ